MEAADLKFENGKFTEDELEQAIIELFQQQDSNGVHWSYANGELLHRRFDEPLIEDRLKSSLRRRYADIDLTEVELQTLVASSSASPRPRSTTGAGERSGSSTRGTHFFAKTRTSLLSISSTSTSTTSRATTSSS